MVEKMEDLIRKFEVIIKSCKKDLEAVKQEQGLKEKLAVVKLKNLLELNSELKKEMPSFEKMLKATNAIALAIKNGLTLTNQGALILTKLEYHCRINLEEIHSLYEEAEIEDRFPAAKDIMEKLEEEESELEAETKALKTQLNAVEEIKKAIQSIEKMGVEPWAESAYKKKIASIKDNLGWLANWLNTELAELKEESEIVKAALALAEAELKRAGF